MIGQVVISYKGSLELIGKSLSQIIKKSSKRTFFCQGLGNQYILKNFDVSDSHNIKGYVSKNKMTSCSHNKGAYIYENGTISYIENKIFKEIEILENDIVLKGGNALYIENNRYKVSVMSASADLGTYKNIYLKAISASANVFIPISFDKYTTQEQNYQVSHKDIDIYMGDFNTINLSLFYGTVYTEIESFLNLFNLKATLFSKASESSMSITKVFLLEGNEVDIKNAIEFLEENN